MYGDDRVHARVMEASRNSMELLAELELTDPAIAAEFRSALVEHIDRTEAWLDEEVEK